MHTTTVRVDADLWNRVSVLAEILGVSKAELFRCAAREYVTRVEAGEQRLDALVAEQMGDLDRRVRRLETRAPAVGT